MNLREKKSWQFLILFASGFVIIALFFDYFFADTDSDVIYFFRVGDFFACILFFIDFISYFKNRKERKNSLLVFLEFLSCVPNLANWGLNFCVWFFYLCALIRIIICALRLLSNLFLGREKALMSIASSLLFSAILISSLLVLNIEKDLPNSNIQNLEDSLWWAISTVTTVGYGDNYPVSINGRIVGVFLMFIGITLFSMLSALVLSWLLTSIVKNENDTSREDISKTIKDIKELINKKLP